MSYPEVCYLQKFHKNMKYNWRSRQLEQKLNKTKENNCNLKCNILLAFVVFGSESDPISLPMLFFFLLRPKEPKAPLFQIGWDEILQQCYSSKYVLTGGV